MIVFYVVIAIIALVILSDRKNTLDIAEIMYTSHDAQWHQMAIEDAIRQNHQFSFISW